MPEPYGGQTMVEPLRRVLLKRPEDAFAVADPARWNYAGLGSAPSPLAGRGARLGLVQASMKLWLYPRLSRRSGASPVLV